MSRLRVVLWGAAVGGGFFLAAGAALAVVYPLPLRDAVAGIAVMVGAGALVGAFGFWLNDPERAAR